MAAEAKRSSQIPWLSMAILVASTGYLVLQGVLSKSSPIAIVPEVALLVAAVFSAVHHAEILAHRVGEPFGSIILALAVTVIEAALIISQMLSGKPGAEFIGRDTVYSAVMIVLTGIVGLCLVVGGARHHEQAFKLDGATAALSVLATLAVIALIIPNYTLLPGPSYSNLQLGFVGFVSLVLYGVFVFVQTVRHKDYFEVENQPNEVAHMPGLHAVGFSSVILPIMLIMVVMFAKLLSNPIDLLIADAGLPKTFVGVIIAAMVLLPEGMAAVQAAHKNQLQKSLNLALGSSIATIGLTLPVLAVFSIWQGSALALGINPTSTVLLALSIFVSSITLATGRTTILQGAVHLVIFGVFLFLAAFP